MSDHVSGDSSTVDDGPTGAPETGPATPAAGSGAKGEAQAQGDATDPGASAAHGREGTEGQGPSAEADADTGPKKRRRRRRRRRSEEAAGDAPRTDGDHAGEAGEAGGAGDPAAAAPVEARTGEGGSPPRPQGGTEGGDTGAGEAARGRRRNRRRRPASAAEGEASAPSAQAPSAPGDPSGDPRAQAPRGEGRRDEGRRRERRDEGRRGEGRGPRREGRRDEARGGGPGRDRSGPRGREGARDEGVLKVSLFAALVGSSQFENFEDREVRCRKGGCKNTWTWSREAQVALKLRGLPVKPPSRLCDQHWAEERSLRDEQAPCRVRGCGRTWTWTREAQLKHRAWYEREMARLEAREAKGAEGEGEAPATERPGKGRRRGRGHRKTERPTDGPPPRLCGTCEDRIKRLAPVELPCKVHGCGKTWTWTREAQLEAWAPLPDHAMPPDPASARPEAAAAPAAPSAGAEASSEGHASEYASEATEASEPPATAPEPAPAAAHAAPSPDYPVPRPPRRMCKSCVEFCRTHQDREVTCGKPGCARTWSYKIGAQLQDTLAGRSTDPLRLACDFSRQHVDCEFRGQPMEVRSPGALPLGAEIMPCVVAGCTQTWVYLPGMRLDGRGPGGELVDRMCDSHRVELGAEARDPRATASAAAADTSADNGGSELAGEASDDAEPGAESETSTAAPAAEAAASGEAPEVEAEASAEGAPDLPDTDELRAPADTPAPSGPAEDPAQGSETSQGDPDPDASPE